MVAIRPESEVEVTEPRKQSSSSTMFSEDLEMISITEESSMVGEISLR
jgi:hypothetical protein